MGPGLAYCTPMHTKDKWPGGENNFVEFEIHNFGILFCWHLTGFLNWKYINTFSVEQLGHPHNPSNLNFIQGL